MVVYVYMFVPSAARPPNMIDYQIKVNKNIFQIAQFIFHAY